MVVVSSYLVKDKKVLLRLDIDVPLQGGRVVDDFRLKAGLPTLKLCLEHSSEVIVMGHIGRPHYAEASLGKPDEENLKELSVEPIFDWLEEQGFSDELQKGKLKLLENLRFDGGEESCGLEYAKELAKLGEVFVNEAFAAYHPAASTTVLPTLLPHLAGLRFAQEVGVLAKVREGSRKPLVVIIGGAKVEDKLPVVEAMAKIADYVLVGGRTAAEIPNSKFQIPKNILVAQLNEEETDVAPETIGSWTEVISQAKMIVWNGPMGKIEDPKNDQTRRLAEIITSSDAETIVGGGDTVGYLGKLGLLGRFGFVSTGGGAMLKFLTEGTLPTVEVLR